MTPKQRRRSPVAACALAAGLLAAAPGTAARAQPVPASNDPGHVESGSYAVEPEHTQVLFSVSHMGFSTYYGQFADASGSLSLDASAPANSSFDIRVPVRSVTTSSPRLTAELKGNAWLDARADPEMVFRSTKVTPMAQGTASVTGDLTLHGVTRSVTLQAKLVGAGINPLNKKYTVGFDLTGSISRSAFGVRTYVPLIGDSVTLTISGAFEKQG